MVGSADTWIAPNTGSRTSSFEERNRTELNHQRVAACLRLTKPVLEDLKHDLGIAQLTELVAGGAEELERQTLLM